MLLITLIKLLQFNVTSWLSSFLLLSYVKISAVNKTNKKDYWKIDNLWLYIDYVEEKNNGYMMGNPDKRRLNTVKTPTSKSRHLIVFHN